MNNSRKKHVSQSLQVKINALNELNKGESEYDVAKVLNVHVETVRSWKKKAKELDEFEENYKGTSPEKKRRLSKIHYPHVDQAVWTWFEQRRSSGVPINGTQIQLQALKIYKEVGGEEGQFTASRGWLHKFKKRHNIRCVTLTGEKNSANNVAAEDFLQFFNRYVHNENLNPHQIFNCDETGLNYRSMPKKSLAARSEVSTSGFKQRKERISVMACSNASGSFKLPLVVIGKYGRPRCLKNRTVLPVYYRHQKSAWMTAGLFKEWFLSEFVPKVKRFLKSMNLPAKAVLLMDNCPSHPRDLLDQPEIKAMYLPPNTTALIQPMDQGILQCLKLKYKEFMMKHILENSTTEVTEVIKSIDLGCVIDWSAKSWDEMSASTIQKSWKPLWPDVIQATSAAIGEVLLYNFINSEEWKNLMTQFLIQLQSNDSYQTVDHQALQEWLFPSNKMTTDETLTDEEIIQVAREELQEERENLKYNNYTNLNGDIMYSNSICDTNSNTVSNDSEVIDFHDSIYSYNRCDNNNETDYNYLRMCSNNSHNILYDSSSSNCIYHNNVNGCMEFLLNYCVSKPLVYSHEDITYLNYLKNKLINEREKTKEVINYQEL